MVIYENKTKKNRNSSKNDWLENGAASKIKK